MESTVEVQRSSCEKAMLVTICGDAAMAVEYPALSRGLQGWKDGRFVDRGSRIEGAMSSPQTSLYTCDLKDCHCPPAPREYSRGAGNDILRVFDVS